MISVKQRVSTLELKRDMRLRPSLADIIATARAMAGNNHLLTVDELEQALEKARARVEAYEHSTHPLNQRMAGGIRRAIIPHLEQRIEALKHDNQV